MKKREITKFQPDGIKLKSKKAFTLAEVLITLGIIGIVAALTIPGLMSRNEERVRATQLKKAYSVLAQTHQMMIVQDIYPYREFVEPFINEEPNETPSEPSNPGGSDDTDTDGGSGSDSGDSGGSGDSGDSGGSGDDGGDNNQQQTTKELIDGILNAMDGFPILGWDWDTIGKNFNALKDTYGLNNPGQCIVDYFDDAGKPLSDSLKEGLLKMDEILGGGKNKGRKNWSYINNETYKVAYLHLLATTSETTASDEDMANFTKIKKYQLEVLKKLLNGASYCPGYDRCNGAEPIEYTTLDGTPAEIEAAEFENSALKTSDGMYLWLGDINNPQRYYMDINGAKRPNKLGVDVFTFDIIKKESIRPEQNANCTMTGSPVDGDAYKGLGCAGYALIDQNPDSNSKGYWRNFR